jgi:hypothetical protein
VASISAAAGSTSAVTLARVMGAVMPWAEPLSIRLGQVVEHASRSLPTHSEPALDTLRGSHHFVVVE